MVNIQFSQMVNHARVLPWRENKDLKGPCSLNCEVLDVFTSKTVVVPVAGRTFYAQNFSVLKLMLLVSYEKPMIVSSIVSYEKPMRHKRRMRH